MNKISREALLEMAREADCYREECGFAECDFDALEHFAELVLAARQQTNYVAWKHDCNALLISDFELWVPNCPHCGKPRPMQSPAVAQATAEESSVVRDAIRSILMKHGFTVKEGHNDLKPYVFEAAEALLRELSPVVAIPAGYKLVPVEPTDEMVVRGAEALSDSFRCLGIDTDEDPRWSELELDIAQSVFSFMIDFAPPHPPLVSANEIVAAELEACAELISSQHTWLTNVAAARLILSRIKK